MNKPIKIEIISHSLMDASYRQLQRLAKHLSVKANLPREELEDALYEVLEDEKEKKNEEIPN